VGYANEARGLHLLAAGGSVRGSLSSSRFNITYGMEHGPKEVQPFKGQDGKMYKSRPRDVKGADWTAFKRGHVDAAFVDFRKWLRSNLEDTARVGMCRESEDDDAKLWIDRSEGDQ
jgi:hypothetical protein